MVDDTVSSDSSGDDSFAEVGEDCTYYNDVDRYCKVGEYDCALNCI